MTALRSKTILLTAALACVGLASLVACDGLGDGDEIVPSIEQAGDQPEACGAPTAGPTLTLSDLDTTVTLNHPATQPINRVDVVGSSSGLDSAADSIFVLMIPIGTDCPSLDMDVVNLQADGSFAARLDLDEFTHVRVVALAAPTGSALSCTDTDACINLAGIRAVSNALEITLQ